MRVRHIFIRLTLVLFILAVPCTAFTPTRAQSTLTTLTAYVTINAAQPGAAIPSDLWGTNLTQQANATQTVENDIFVSATRQIRVRLIRWPGGNNADAYDWKRDEDIRPGRRVQRANSVDLARILTFTRDTGTELSITVNFGTMSAQDAADLVEFLNGPADSPWGERRAALGFPEPLGVRYFEIGNEIGQPHMWYYAWTAEDPVTYFFGGEEERRGFYNNASNREYDPVGVKGDFFKAEGGPNQTYTLRFPPVRNVQVFAFVDENAAQTCLTTYRQTGNLPTVPAKCGPWTETADLSSEPANAHVYMLDSTTGELRFGDGVHGAMPPRGSFFLVEYTTYGHDGFLDMARAMRAAPSNVPIQVGAAILPFVDGQPITDTVGMQAIFSQMDFYVRHQYDAAFLHGLSALTDQIGRPPSPAGRSVRISGPLQNYDDELAFLRQIPLDRVEHLATVYDRVRAYAESIGLSRSPNIAVTEWNVFLNQQYWHINRTQLGAVIAAEWFARLLNAREEAPVLYANQFALSGGNLALIRSQTNHSIAPMGYVFQGFGDWPTGRVLPVEVQSPTALAYDRDVPDITAAAALAPDNRTLHVVMINNALTQTITTTLTITDFTPARGVLWQLAAADPLADNDTNPANVVPYTRTFTSLPNALPLPPASVTFLTLTNGTPRHIAFPLLGHRFR